MNDEVMNIPFGTTSDYENWANKDAGDMNESLNQEAVTKLKKLEVVSEPKTELPEAPASVTFNVTSPTGFDALFTVRDTTGLGLLGKMAVIEKKLGELGYKPQVRKFGAKKEVVYVEGKVCPLCKGRLIEKVSKDGKKYHACENGKYDFTTKQTLGCKYVDWLD